MVYVNGTKFACASCIKGHRSSSCHHSDRPLFEIKKKGRPISQCEKCRELRKNKRMHVRCTCGQPSVIMEPPPMEESSPNMFSRRSAQRRIPTVPSLPNGLHDIYKLQGKPGSSSHPKQKVINLLNPCQCPSLRNCTCSPIKSDRVRETRSIHREFVESSQEIAGHSLAQNYFQNDSSAFEDDLKLPPLKWFDTSVACKSTEPRLLLPGFSTLCGSDVDPFRRCTCGSSCICLGCKEHRRNNATSNSDCPDNCGTCVDNLGCNQLDKVLPNNLDVSLKLPRKEYLSIDMLKYSL